MPRCEDIRVTGEPVSESGKSLDMSKLSQQLQKIVVGTVENGVGPIVGSVAYADARMAHRLDRLGRDEPTDDDIEAVIRQIIRESVVASGGTGFVTGVGGFVALPITLPANIAGNLVINARMVGAIAYLRGYDLDDPYTQALLMLTVAGSNAQAVISGLGVKVGQEAAKQALKKIPRAVLIEINKRAGFYLVAKYGTKRAAITLVKAVPLVGGVIGGGIDAGLTKAVGSLARRAFPTVDPGEEPTFVLVSAD